MLEIPDPDSTPDENGWTTKVIRQKVMPRDIASVTTAMVYWSATQISHGYSLNHGGALVEWPQLFDNAVNYYCTVLGATPRPSNIGLPQEIYEYLIFEKHGLSQQDPRTNAPIPYARYEGYVPLAVKLDRRSRMDGWVKPTNFLSDTEPGPVTEALVMRYPPATTPMEKTTDSLHPKGKGWYAVLVVRLRKQSRVAKRTNQSVHSLY